MIKIISTILKIIIFFIISFLLLNNNSSAANCDNSCMIKNGPSPLLKEYLDQNNQLLQNINSDLSKITPPPRTLGKRLQSNIYNALFNWSDVFTQTEFLELELEWEIPTMITRDLELIQQQSETLNAILERLIKRWYTTETIENICQWVNYCELKWSVTDILTNMIANNNNLLSFFRLSIMWRQNEFDRTFILVPDTFISELYNYYNPYTITDCSKCDWEFGSVVEQSIRVIMANVQEGKDWFQEWRDAMTLLQWWNTANTNYQEKEHELLQKELAKQWISWGQAGAMMNNLARYNNTNYSNSNNSVDNSYNRFALNTDWLTAKRKLQELDSFAKNYFGNNTTTSWENVSIPLSQINTITTNTQSSNDIIKNLDIIYQRQIPFLAAQDLNSEKLQARIIQMHIDLSQSINILDKTIASSEKVCNDQDNWSGRCTY